LFGNGIDSDIPGCPDGLLVTDCFNSATIKTSLLAQ
jgi:hypothetical protein